MAKASRRGSAQTAGSRGISGRSAGHLAAERGGGCETGAGGCLAPRIHSGCWFESGSMPYAQQHYPFQHKEVFEANFPADFIAEGIDQTRVWFYTLMVLSSCLFDKPAFKNLICNGCK